jgi:hypothetical protein
VTIRDHGLFRRLDTPAPDAAQGGCYVSHDTGPCVDTGILVETEGTLTLSLNVIKELAEVAGFSVNEEGEELERINAEQEHFINQLTDECAELRSQLDAVGLAVAHVAGIQAAQQ